MFSQHTVFDEAAIMVIPVLYSVLFCTATSKSVHIFIFVFFIHFSIYVERLCFVKCLGLNKLYTIDCC